MEVFQMNDPDFDWGILLVGVGELILCIVVGLVSTKFVAPYFSNRNSA
jgi:hypothetical protein